MKKRSSRILNLLNGADTARSAQSFEATKTEEEENWITINLTSYAQEKLHFAADLLGVSLVDFAVQAGLEQAEKIIAQHEKNKTRQPGSMRGKISVAADFEAPLTISTQIQNIPDSDNDSDWVRNPITQELLDVLNGRAPSPLDVLKDTVMKYADPLDPVICPDYCDGEKPLVLSGFTESDAISLSKAGLNAFFNICRDWQLTNDQEIILLGAPSSGTYYEWKKSPETDRLDPDTLVRISYILGIYKSLQILLPIHTVADAWIRKPNDAPLFLGKSALDHMLSGNISDLSLVRQYLDSEL